VTFEACWVVAGVWRDLDLEAHGGSVCLGDYVGRFLGGNIPEVSGKT